MISVHLASCVEWLAAYDGPLFDSCVTDPPYHLSSIVKRFGAEGAAQAKAGKTGAYARASKGFMGQQWDGGDVAFQPETWRAVYDALKPGAHLVAFSGTRTYHRMACAIEDAGFEIRDQLAWTYGSGFPKSHDVSKGIDKAAGHWRGRAGAITIAEQVAKGTEYERTDKGRPITSSAAEWQGWGTALKPAYEPICFAQKPYTTQEFLATLVPTVRSLICKVASFEKTDTHLFELLRASGFLSIASSLNNSLAALSGHESRCTTETASVLTTDLKTLRSSLSRIMHAITTPESSPTSGGASDAWVAAAISKNVLASFERLASTTAGEIAIDWRAPAGTAPAGNPLSPNWEPICLARKPLIGSVAANVQAHGTGAINIDGCRVGAEGGTSGSNSAKTGQFGIGGKADIVALDAGRWPANILHDGSDEVLAGFPDTASGQLLTHHKRSGQSQIGTFEIRDRTGEEADWGGDSGSAARFFYSAKAGPLDRIGSKHATVKPVDLMRWLVRLVTPKGGHVLEPFAGSGTTGIAAMAEGFDCTMIELMPDHVADIERKLAYLRGEGAATFVEHNRHRAPADASAMPLFGDAA